MNKRYLSILAIAAIGLLTIINSLVLVRGNASAARLSAPSIPQRISYQGRLTDVDGNPLNGAHNMTFRLYDHPTAGTLCWTESQDVTVNYGVFTVLLGDITPIESTCFSGSDLYLGVEVGSDGEMMPRRRVVSVGYAYKAEEASTASDADTLDGLHASDFAMPSVVPTGAIILWDGSSCPDGYSRVAAWDGAMLKVGPTYIGPTAAGPAELPAHTHGSGSYVGPEHLHNLWTSATLEQRAPNNGIPGGFTYDAAWKTTHIQAGGAGSVTGTSASTGSGSVVTVMLCQKE